MNKPCKCGEDIMHCWSYSCLEFYMLSQRTGTDTYHFEDTCVFRTMIFNTFASQKSVRRHPKSTLREALEPTWTTLGQNIKKQSKT